MNGFAKLLLAGLFLGAGLLCTSTAKAQFYDVYDYGYDDYYGYDYGYYDDYYGGYYDTGLLGGTYGLYDTFGYGYGAPGYGGYGYGYGYPYYTNWYGWGW